VSVAWNPDDYSPDSAGTFKISGDFIGEGIGNPQNIRPYIEITLTPKPV
jgi:hypothetical protein